jgi:hypothetical protein
MVHMKFGFCGPCRVLPSIRSSSGSNYFDQDRRISLDSGSAEYVDKALALAEQLISQAEQLSKT